MTDIEKIRLLENENLSLRVEIAQLKQELSELDEMKEQMAALMNDTQSLISALKQIRANIETDVKDAHQFKNLYASATKEAMKQTVQPYIKSIKAVKKKRRKTK